MCQYSITHRVEEARALADRSTISQKAQEESDRTTRDQDISQLVNDGRSGEFLRGREEK